MSAKNPAGNITLLPYRERVALVRARLNYLNYPKTTPLPKPAVVQAAEKRLREWQEKNDAHEEAQLMRWYDRRNEIQDALIVGDMQKAIDLLQRFEADFNIRPNKG